MSRESVAGDKTISGDRKMDENEIKELEEIVAKKASAKPPSASSAGSAKQPVPSIWKSANGWRKLQKRWKQPDTQKKAEKSQGTVLCLPL